MNSKLKISAGILLVFIASLAGSRAQFPGATPGAGAGPGAPVTFDPTTGMPIAPSDTDWKDPNWKDPDITLTNVVYDNLPLSEIAQLLRQEFKQQFDILLPGNTPAAISASGQAVPTVWQTDWRSEPITLRLKNVTAIEIFTAMNLVFENDRTPLRWYLKVNGHRQIALLHVLVDPVPQGGNGFNAFGGGPVPQIERRVYWVGNLIGDEKNGGMSMEQIIKTVTDVWEMAKDNGGNIQFHKEAQLLVVSGTPNQIDFMEQTLKALGQKVEQERAEHMRKSSAAAETKSAPPSR